METFTIEGKALTTTEDERGDLILEGYGALWDGEDRQKENFAPGAFERSIKDFLAGGAPLVYHHKNELVLGKVLAIKEEKAGVWIKARVDGAIRNSPKLGHIYQQIKRGTIKGLSFSGFFTRSKTGSKTRIIDIDLVELSCTPVQVHPKTGFQVVETKAMADSVPVESLATYRLGREVEATTAAVDFALTLQRLSRL
jgi:HK97 family phage prohead protease